MSSETSVPKPLLHLLRRFDKTPTCDGQIDTGQQNTELSKLNYALRDNECFQHRQTYFWSKMFEASIVVIDRPSAHL